jgi:hypothetical protein
MYSFSRLLSDHVTMYSVTRLLSDHVTMYSVTGLLSDHITLYSVIFHYLNTFAVKTVRLMSANICVAIFKIKKIRTHSTRNANNFDAHVSHKSLNKVKWKCTTVDPKIQLFLSLLSTHTTLFTFHMLKYKSKIISHIKNQGFMGKVYQVFHCP